MELFFLDLKISRENPSPFWLITTKRDFIFFSWFFNSLVSFQISSKKKIPTTINQFLITPEDFYTDIAHVNHRGRYQALLAMDPNSEEGREHQSSIAHYQMMTKDLTSEYRIYITPNPEDNALVTSTLFNALRNHYAKTQKPFYSDINIFDDYSQQGAPERTITITTASKKDAQQTLDVVYNALMSYPGRFHYGVPFRMSATSLISWGQGSELYKQDRLKALYDAERVYYRPGVVGLPGADYHLTNPAD